MESPGEQAEMTSAGTWPRVVAAATLLVSLVALLLAAGAEHAALFSAQPMVMPGAGFAVAGDLFHLAIPFLIAAGHRTAVGWGVCGRPFDAC
jgi:hypothetical protein